MAKKFVSKASIEKVAKKSKAYTDSSVQTLDNSLEAVAKSGAAADVSVASISGLTATTAQGAIAELLSKVTSGDVTVDTSSTTTGMLRSYTIKKGNVVIGTIDIPKDLINGVVGIVSQDGSGNAGTFLKVKTSAVGEADTFEYHDLSGLIEYVTSGSTAGDMCVVSIDAQHKVTVTITDGTVTKAKLASGVQSSLDKADSALQETDLEDVTDSELSTWFGETSGE